MSQALYQKYRPQSFDEVIGQADAIKYLKNIVDNHKQSGMNHAYLLTGSRGVGKTTLARIFARSLGIADIDIIELDTASNRGIDEVKELREATLARPISSDYKVFIMDEVHMITTQGANALLKTLEEPTPWTIFILCTTDPEKLISTIVSRCQVINLKSPNESTVYELLSRINQAEKFQIDNDTLQFIANLNHESYRDAIGELERVSKYVDEKGAIANILRIDYDKVALDIVKALVTSDIKAAFNIINNVNAEHSNNVYHKIYLHIVKVYRLLLLIRANVSELIDPNTITNEIRNEIAIIEKTHKEAIRSQVLATLLDNERIWNYNSINNREKLELILLNVNAIRTT